MHKLRNRSLLLLLCAVPLTLTACGLRYSVHEHRVGYHAPPPPPKYHHPGYHHAPRHHGHHRHRSHHRGRYHH